MCYACQDYRQTSSVTTMLHKLEWEPLQKRRACSRVWMFYRICNGLVAIPTARYLKPTLVHSRRHETRYTQMHCKICNTSMYSHTFFPSAIRLWNSLPIDICQLPPESFKEKLSTSTWINCKPSFYPVFIQMHGTFYHHLLEVLLCTTSSAHDHHYAAWFYSELSRCQHRKKKKEEATVFVEVKRL